MWHLIPLSICSSFLQILLLLSLIRASYTFDMQNCNLLSVFLDCDCTYNWYHWTIKCPGAEIFIHTMEDEEQYVVIKKWSEVENNSLPKMDIGSSYKLTIANCELSGEPIALLLQQLGINNVKFLSIHNNIIGVNLTHLLTGLSRLQGLNLYSNNLTILPTKLFVDLSNVTTLSIHEHLAELPHHIFDPLEILTELDLANNSLNQLPNGIFRNQHQLEKLNMNGNKLSNISKTTFKGAKSLQILDLSNNNLDSFEPDIFSLLPNLSEIYLGGNEFRELPSQLFANNKKLTLLHINENNNTLEFLPSALLANLSDLQEFHVSYSNYSSNKNIKFSWRWKSGNQISICCGFRDIPGSLFTSSSNWTVVSIVNNNMRFIPDNIFADQQNLKWLNLSHNKLQSLQNSTFRNTRKLILLDLSYNQLTELSDGIFFSLGSLERLYLENNKLLSLPCDLFLKTTYLVELRLSYNQLTEMSLKIFSPLVNLEVLYLDNNLISECTDAFGVYRYKRYLSLENNHTKCQETFLEETPFDLLEKLRKLKLRNNSIQHMYWDFTTALPNLEELDLSFNSITTLHYRDFKFQQRWLRVDMSHNQVRTIDFKVEILMTEASNHSIDLRYNPLDCDCKLVPFSLYLSRSSYSRKRFKTDSLFCDTPKSIGHRLFDELKPEELICSVKHPYCPLGCICWERTYDATLIFNCSNINLTKAPVIPVTQATAFKVIELHIENNELRELSTISFDGYAKVTKIYATGNNISQIAVHNLPMELTHLDLSHNYLKRLDPKVIDFFNESHSLIHLTLAGNPWDCNCESKSLFQFAKRQSIITDYEKMICATPKNGTMHDYSFDGCICRERTYDATLIFNCSNINLTKLPGLPVIQATSFKAIELHIENNKLHELPTVYIDGYAKVAKIYATGNNISQIAVHNLPMELTHLDLSHNNLKQLDPNVIDFLLGSHSLTQLILAGNPWDCNCERRSFFLFAERQSIITDYEQMFCATPKIVTIHNYFIDNLFCQEEHRVFFTSPVSVLSVCLLVSIIVLVWYKYGMEIKIWIHSNPWLRGIFSQSEVDENKNYDAFVSYSHKDREFVGTILVPGLERDGPIQFKLCIHVRDFIVGEYIADQIIRAIDESRRTIIVLSKHFIKSVWANMEFRLAHQAAVVERRTRVIVIMYGDLGDLDSVEPLLRAYLKTNTYLEWGDPLFWDRLRNAMPHPENAPPNESTQATTAV